MPYIDLVKGFNNFQKEYFLDKKNTLYKDLVEKGQQPDTLIIACSDSRIEPAILTGSKPGDFFAIRNIAALVAPYSKSSDRHSTSAAIEYAVRCLNVKHIIVIGHSQCGGINALANQNDATDFEFIKQWLEVAKPARRTIFTELAKAKEKDRTKALEQASVLTSLKNLMSYPWIKKRHDKKQISIHGWYFDMAAEQLLEFKESSNSFKNILDYTGDKGVANLPSLQKFAQQYSQKCGCSSHQKNSHKKPKIG